MSVLEAALPNPTAKRECVFATHLKMLSRSMVSALLIQLHSSWEMTTSIASPNLLPGQSGVSAKRRTVEERFVTSTGAGRSARWSPTPTTSTTTANSAEEETTASALVKTSTCSVEPEPCRTRQMG